MPSLAEQHRKAQLALRNITLRDLLRLWPAFNLEDIKGTWPALEQALLLLIEARGKQSSGLAVAFYRELRDELGPGGHTTPRLDAPSREEVLKGLLVVGPVNAGAQLARNRPLEVVKKATLVNLSGEVSRHVLNYGRRTLSRSLVADQTLNGHAIGVRRITGQKPCNWCADQASRTYPPTETFPAHSHCGCSPSFIYRN